MDLFAINRYKGEIEDNDENNEEQKLHKVVEKIRQRKKNKLKLENKNEENEEKHVENETTVMNDQQEKGVFDETDEEVETESVKKKVKIDDIEGFTVLHTNTFEKRKKVKRVLPYWLQNPHIFLPDFENLTTRISDLDLCDSLKTKLQSNGIDYLFPVQEAFIPWHIKKAKCANIIPLQDVCISSPTGSGKTLAFVIPIIQYLLSRLENGTLTIKAIRALVILPTQSLALQIYNTFKCYTSGTEIDVGIIAGGHILGHDKKQLFSYNSIWGVLSKIDILVCTPGRLIDHLKLTKDLDFKYLEFIVIDEADRTLDSVQDDWLYFLENCLQKVNKCTRQNSLLLDLLKSRRDPQKLLFSATLTHDPEKLQRIGLFQPKLFTCYAETHTPEENTGDRHIGKYLTPKELTEKYLICNLAKKPLVLYKLITDAVKNKQSAKIMVFVNDTNTIYRLSLLMCVMAKRKFKVAQFLKQRNVDSDIKKNILKSFETGDTNVLICSDIMARGIDMPNVDLVVLYAAPSHLKTYIHRVGRTARAGLKGECVTILQKNEEKKFLNLFSNMKKNFIIVQYNDDDLQKFNSLYSKSLLYYQHTLKKRQIQQKKKEKNKMKIIVKKSVKQL